MYSPSVLILLVYQFSLIRVECSALVLVLVRAAMLQGMRSGHGENGRAVSVPRELEAEAKDKFRVHQFNLIASDLVSVNRSLPDYRSWAYAPPTLFYYPYIQYSVDAYHKYCTYSRLDCSSLSHSETQWSCKCKQSARTHSTVLHISIVQYTEQHTSARPPAPSFRHTPTTVLREHCQEVKLYSSLSRRFRAPLRVSGAPSAALRCARPSALCSLALAAASLCVAWRGVAS